ncbi:MAG: transcription antitermination factor NusB [Oscillospiraceae bacterium]
MKRREARELAFAILFEKTFKDESIDEIIKNASEDREIVVDDYVRNTCINVELNLAVIDDLISKYLTKWKINRISRVSLTALRLGVYELEFVEDIPEKVSINESVELAKKYEGEDSASFVNGVLGAFIRAKKAEE